MSERQGDRKDAEGPEPGSDAMEDLVREAEDNAEKNTADEADRQQNRQMQEGTENTS